MSHHYLNITITSTSRYILRLHYPKTWQPIRSKYSSFKESYSLWIGSSDICAMSVSWKVNWLELWWRKSRYGSNAVKTNVQRSSTSIPMMMMMTMIVTMTMRNTLLRRWTRSRGKLWWPTTKMKKMMIMNSIVMIRWVMLFHDVSCIRDSPRKDVEPEKFISAFSQHLKRQGDVKRFFSPCQVLFFWGGGVFYCFSVSILGVYMGVPST